MSRFLNHMLQVHVLCSHVIADDDCAWWILWLHFPFNCKRKHFTLKTIWQIWKYYTDYPINLSKITCCYQLWSLANWVNIRHGGCICSNWLMFRYTLAYGNACLYSFNCSFSGSKIRTSGMKWGKYVEVVFPVHILPTMVTISYLGMGNCVNFLFLFFYIYSYRKTLREWVVSGVRSVNFRGFFIDFP